MKVKRSLVTVVLIFLIILSGCTQAKEEKDDHLTVFLWESRLIKYLVPYIREQFPDKDIENSLSAIMIPTYILTTMNMGNYQISSLYVDILVLMRLI